MLYSWGNNKRFAVIHKQKLQLVAFFSSLILFASTLIGGGLVNACSATPDPNQGTDNLSVTAPTTGTYYVWAQIQASPTSNSFYLQANGGCAITVSGGNATSFTWVSAANPVALNGAANSIVLTGNGAGVGVEGLFFAPLAPSTGCSPTNTAACTPTDNPPTVSMSAPANNTTVSGTATVSASATDDHGVKNVQFQLDGQNLGTAVGTPVSGSTYQTSWNTATATNGSHKLTAVATDSSGQSTTSGATTVTVSNSTGTQTPGQPTNLHTTSVSSSQVQLAWTAPTGTDAAASYKVYRNGTSIGTPTGTSFTDGNVSQGATYSYAVSAVDASHNEGTKSASINTTISDTTLPSVSLTAPSNNATVSGKVTVSATATDNVAVKSVQFYLNYGTSNATTLGGALTSTSTNYSYSWDTTGTANGSYTVTAVATDGTNRAVATPVTVTVNNQTQTGGSGTIVGLSFNTTTKTLSWNAYGGAASYSIAEIHDPTGARNTNYAWPHVSGTSCVPGGSCNVPAPASGETLNFNVDPLDANGNLVAGAINWGTKEITVTWPTSVASTPPVPTGLAATAQGSSQINLTWGAGSFNGDPATSYQIYRQTGSGSFAQIGTATNTTYGDSGLNASTTYNYYVIAVDSGGHKSTQSSTASATTPGTTTGRYTATVQGVVSDANTGKPIANATVTSGQLATVNGSEVTQTNAQGQYVLTNLDTKSKHHYTISASGYRSQTYYITLPTGITIANVKLSPR